MLFDRFDEVHQQRAYETENILEKLADAGFRDIKAYGDFAFEKPKKDAERVFFVGRK